MAIRLTDNFGETDGLNELNGIDEERVSNENRFRGSDHRNARGSADVAPAQGENEDQEAVEEAAEVKRLPDVSMPCAAEIEVHNLTHLPFRDWCPCCVQGKAVSYPHTKRKKEENEVPVISSDYMGLKRRDPRRGRIQ